MGNSIKYLKITSIALLIYTIFSAFEIAIALYFGEFDNVAIPEGSPDNILAITKTFILVVSVLLLLPQLYLGIKGLRVAANPTSSKGHIVLAIVIFVFVLISAVTAIQGIASGEETDSNVSALLSLMVEVAIYFEYILYAIRVAKEN